jgi:hypothetical protein
MTMNKVRLSTVAFMLVAAMSAGACGGMLGMGGGSSRDYQITTNKDSYSRGNIGEATIRNSSGDRIEYNLCPRRLERQVDRNWVAAFEWPTSGSACTAEARTLSPGSSVNTFFDIPTGIPAGTYRVVFTGLLDSDRKAVSADRAATSPFQVR